MRHDRMPKAEPRPSDSNDTLAALEKLKAAGIDARRPPKNNHQIKVGALSYYPTTGTIVPDGEFALSINGIDAFIQYIQENVTLSV